MTDRQEDRMSMFDVVIGICDEHIDLISPKMAMLATYNKFKAKVQLINDISIEQLEVMKGLAVEKKQLKRQLATSAAIVARVVTSYAMDLEDYVLVGEVDYSETELYKYRDEIIHAHCQIIFNRAQAHDTAMLDYGISTEILTDLQAAITEFEEKSAAPTLARAAKKVATQRLKEEIKATMELLKLRLDNNMSIFRLTDPHFYKLYKSSRKIRKSGGRKKKVAEVVG